MKNLRRRLSYFFRNSGTLVSETSLKSAKEIVSQVLFSKSSPSATETSLSSSIITKKKS